MPSPCALPKIFPLNLPRTIQIPVLCMVTGPIINAVLPFMSFIHSFRWPNGTFSWLRARVARFQGSLSKSISEFWVFGRMVCDLPC